MHPLDVENAIPNGILEEKCKQRNLKIRMKGEVVISTKESSLSPKASIVSLEAWIDNYFHENGFARSIHIWKKPGM